MNSRRTKKAYSALLVISIISCAHSFVVQSVFGRVGRSASFSFRSTVKDEENGIAVGIDLGTTHSAVAIMKNGIPEMISIPHNGRTMPSVVHIGKDDKVLVGREAIEKEVDNPCRTYRNVKRVIGISTRKASEVADVVPNLEVPTILTMVKKRKKQKKDVYKEMVDAVKNPARLLAPMDYSQDQGPAPNRETISPELISSCILRHLIEKAEEATGEKVTRAVVGIPAYFHDEQEEATKRACRLAGVEKVSLLREPEAAALAYGVGRDQVGAGETDEFVLVMDLGGGTYDVSMLLVGGRLTQVIATGGNPALGGADFDLEIAKHWTKLLRIHGAEQNFLNGDAADAIVRSAEMARIHLSNNRNSFLALPLTEEGWTSMANSKDVLMKESEETKRLEETGISNTTHVLCKLSRSTIETLCDEQFHALLRPLREVAIMSGAMLPGDSDPRAVQAVLDQEMEQSQGKPLSLDFENFYLEDEVAEGKETRITGSLDDPEFLKKIEEMEEQEIRREQERGIDDQQLLLQLREMEGEVLAKELKKEQQRGRKKAREVSRKGRKYQEEKRKIKKTAPKGTKVMNGILGRPISRVVLVGGATRMPAFGRIVERLTGITPQRTVNPDEAVALGCAVQGGVLDGDENLQGLAVLRSFEAEALLRAIAEEEAMKNEETEQNVVDPTPNHFETGDVVELDDFETMAEGSVERKIGRAMLIEEERDSIESGELSP